MNNGNKLLVGYIIIVFIYLLALVVILSSCQVLKGKEEKQVQAVVVDSATAGKVTESKTTVSTDWEWFKTTMQYANAPKGGDTIINKNYYTSNLPAPQVIIMEGGKGQQQAVVENKDSIWENRFARLEATLSEKSKTKETQVLSMWQIIGIAAGGVLIAVVLSKVKMHF